MIALRLAGLSAAALLLSHPAVALADDCDGPCPCTDDCGIRPPAPPPNLPPSVAVYGSGHADQRFDYYHDGVHQTQFGGETFDYVVRPGAIGDAPMTSGSNTGAYSANVSFYPDAKVEVGARNGEVDAQLLYSVVLHAPDEASADYVRSLLNTSGAIAQVSGYSSLTASTAGMGSYADDFVTTGEGIFSSDEPVASGLYGVVSNDIGLFARTSFDCDFRTYGYQQFGTSGCGVKKYTLPVNFVSATSYAGGSDLDFIGNIELTAAATSLAAGPADSILDPVVDFSSGFNGQGFTLTIGGGQVANGGVPEPAAWGLMLLGFTSLGAALRRRRTALA